MCYSNEKTCLELRDIFRNASSHKCEYGVIKNTLLAQFYWVAVHWKKFTNTELYAKLYGRKYFYRISEEIGLWHHNDYMLCLYGKNVPHKLNNVMNLCKSKCSCIRKESFNTAVLNLNFS
jgi:hypothetical protein